MKDPTKSKKIARPKIAAGPEANSAPSQLARLSDLARQRISSALGWLPKTLPQLHGGAVTKQDDASGSRGLSARDAMLKAVSERYSYPIIDLNADGGTFSRELVVGHDPFGEAAEAIRSIRSEVAANALANGKRSMLVVGPRSQSGSTYLVCNLAVAFAQMSIPTLLVDANLRMPRVAEIFGLSSQDDGLVELLLRRTRDVSPIKHNVIPNLSVLPAGAIPPNPQELLASPEFLAMANTFDGNFGVVLYDTAPGMEFADALVVGARVGTAIIVGRKHQVHWKDMQALSKKLASIKCTVVGAVLNAA